MDKNIIVGLVIAILIVIGGSLYYFFGNVESPDIIPPVPDAALEGESANTPQNEQVAGSPIVVTSSTNISSDNSVSVVGTVNPKGVFTNYWYEYGVSSNFGNKIGSQTIGSGFVSLQAPGYITNLTKNTTYYFRLVAENQYGKSFGNTYTFKTTDGNPVLVGSVPTTKTLSATGISRTGANLSGEVTPNKASTQYWFEYGKSENLGSVSSISSVGNGSAKITVSASLSGLEALTTYYFRLNAQNQFGTTNGSILNFKTSGPISGKAPSVTTGSASLITTSGATLHGTVIPNLSETKFWFEYSDDSSLKQSTLLSTEKVLVGVGGVVVPIDKVITGLNSKTKYYFRIVAQNSSGTTLGQKATFTTK